MKRFESIHVYAVSFAALAALFFVTLLLQLQRHKALWVDTYIKGYLRGEGDVSFFSVAGEMGAEPGVAVVLVLALTWLWRKKRYVSMLMFPFSIAVTQIVNKTVKELVARERPVLEGLMQEDGYSFPSGHAMIAVVLYGFLIYLIFHEKVGKPMKVIVTAAAVLLILVVGVSRIVLSAHYPSDVLGGYGLGGMLLIACCYADHYLHARKQK